MNEKEDQNLHKQSDPSKSDWSFCPICGNELPNIQNLRFCIKCGTNLKYLKDHKTLPSESPYKVSKYTPKYLPTYITHKRPKIADKDLINIKEHKIWGPGISIGLTMASYFMMNLIVFAISFLIIFVSFDLNLISNSYFTALISLVELVFLLFPLIFAGKYLENPTLKNRFILLGFTTRGYDKKGIVREIFIGLGFAVAGVIMVNGISILLEIIIEFAFGTQIVRDTGGLETGIIPQDIGSLILLCVVMIVVIGTSEEILFRGFLQKGLVRKVGNTWGILITAIIFTMIHLIGVFTVAILSPLLAVFYFLLSFFPYFAISLLLGWLYHWRKENLLAVMITHGVYDVLTVLIVYFLFIFF
ncbi:MAG: CPBP family intramembrane glutamic endopeptidase [Candidatus Thorarchaeota archaeon]